jgi:hypothetical protein
MAPVAARRYMWIHPSATPISGKHVQGVSSRGPVALPSFRKQAPFESEREHAIQFVRKRCVTARLQPILRLSLVLLLGLTTLAAQTNSRQAQGVPDQIGISNIAIWSGAESYSDLGVISDISTYTGTQIDLYISPRFGGNPSGALNFSSDGDTALDANASIGFDQSQDAPQYLLPSDKGGQRSNALLTPSLESSQNRLITREDLLPSFETRAPATSESFYRAENRDMGEADSSWYRNDSVSAGLARIQAETANLPCVQGCAPAPAPEVAVARSALQNPGLTTYSVANVSKTGTGDSRSVVSGAIAAPFAHAAIPEVRAPEQLRMYSAPSRRPRQPAQPR